jgi:hypothetical protein
MVIHTGNTSSKGEALNCLQLTSFYTVGSKRALEMLGYRQMARRSCEIEKNITSGENAGNAWIQTNGQEKLRDREKHITFCENSALQNARASSNFNPAPYTPKHKPPVL